MDEYTSYIWDEAVDSLAPYGMRCQVTSMEFCSDIITRIGLAVYTGAKILRGHIDAKRLVIAWMYYVMLTQKSMFMSTITHEKIKLSVYNQN